MLKDSTLTARQVRKARQGRVDLIDRIKILPFDGTHADKLEAKEMERLEKFAIGKRLMTSIVNLKKLIAVEFELWDVYNGPNTIVIVDNDVVIKKELVTAKDLNWANIQVMKAGIEHHDAMLAAQAASIFTNYDGIKEVKAEREADRKNRKIRGRKQGRQQSINDAAALGIAT